MDHQSSSNSMCDSSPFLFFSLGEERRERWRAYGGAYLDVVFAHRSAVVHGVKGSYLVDAHGRHLQQPRHLVHHADGAEAVLALAQIQQRHDSRLLVVGGVPAEDLLDQLLVLRAELERQRGVVVGRVAVLQPVLAVQLTDVRGREKVRTTMRLSLRAGRVTLKARN